jgi:uncharacterized protein (DUF433 family)
MKDESWPPVIHSDPGTLGGMPVFKGTRLPVQTFLDCVNSGEAWERLIEWWPYLTLAHLEAARRWEAESPFSRQNRNAAEAARKAEPRGPEQRQGAKTSQRS